MQPHTRHLWHSDSAPRLGGLLVTSAGIGSSVHQLSGSLSGLSLYAMCKSAKQWYVHQFHNVLNSMRSPTWLQGMNNTLVMYITVNTMFYLGMEKGISPCHWVRDHTKCSHFPRDKNIVLIRGRVQRAKIKLFCVLISSVIYCSSGGIASLANIKQIIQCKNTFFGIKCIKK